MSLRGALAAAALAARRKERGEGLSPSEIAEVFLVRRQERRVRRIRLGKKVRA
ncbi:hypothetical protein [Thermus sp. NEB1569]|uniref:hypothetical protein n=1 Tax=Thermus sp. NEB1569 TaxID=2918899 RepID=UPI001EFBA285|nr:hypothetical protein [Thermus sp. NEB1569]ULR39697.1 hypothetical protein MI302_00375 [Thermus sp. NEB1569]